MTSMNISDETTTFAVELIVYPVADLARAKAFFTKLLDTTPYVDEAYYVGFRSGAQEIGLDPSGHSRGLNGPISYWRVDDISTRVAMLVDGGAELQQPVQDVGGGMLIAILKDADGNLIGLRQYAAA